MLRCKRIHAFVRHVHTLASNQSQINKFRFVRPTEPDFDPMPRYFFNTRIGDELIADPEGEELRNPDRAWEVARAMIRELLKSEGAEGGLLRAILEVTDDDGEIVLEFPFAEAVLEKPGKTVTKH
jgi:hypothetical protein